MPGCAEWGQERHRECNERRDAGRNECNAWRDNGLNSCAGWDRRCCDWWPCSWFCKLISWFCVAWVWIANWVCVGWTWVSNWVCIAWTWTTTAVCLVWDLVTTIINAILVTLESTLGWLLSALATLAEALQAIPVLGTALRWFVNATGVFINTLASAADAVLGAVGIRPEKLLRVCTVILRDEENSPVAVTPDVVSVLQLACDVYKRDANVRIVPLAPFRYTSGFAGTETASADWVQTDARASDGDTLDPPCDAGTEWVLPGSKFQGKVTQHCFLGAWRRISGYGAPVTVFIVRSVPGNLGCSLWITDYVTVAGEAVDPRSFSFSPRTLGHEIAHSCNLWHVCVDDDVRNLMATGGACNPASSTVADRFNPRMSNWQALLVRASRHVSYF